MLSVQLPLDSLYLLVTGYEDGSDWLVGLPKRRAHHGDQNGSHGASGRHVWALLDGNQIAIYDAQERRLVGLVAPPEPAIGMIVRGSRDGTRLFAHAPQGSSPATLVLFVIDPASATIVARHDGPYQSITELVEDSEGHLLYPLNVRSGERVQTGLGRLDPRTGEREISTVADTGPPEVFRWHSPDGRYWLRLDNRIAREEIAEGRRGFFSKPTITPFYSSVVQLWEAWPLRFVRWLPVGWRAFDDLPDMNGRARRPTDPAFRRKAWDAIAAASDAAPHDPLIPVTAPDLKGPHDDTSAEGTEAGKNWSQLIRNHRLLGWDDDATAFWMNEEGFVTHVKTSGTASVSQFASNPRQPTIRLNPSGAHPLPGGRLAVKHVSPVNGLLILAPADDGPGRPVEIALELRPSGDAELYERIEADKADRSRILVSLRSWSEADAIAAIEAVTTDIASTLAARAVTHHAYAEFRHEGRDIAEQEFFASVAASFPAAAPAIARLIETACDQMRPHMELYSAEDEVGLFGYAARALGLMDLNFLPTLMRYRRIVIDSEHETFFTLKTVPLLIEKHGWTAEMTEFVLWLLLIGNTNGLDGTVWESWNLREAVTGRYTPASLADLTRRLCGTPPEADKRYPIAHTYRGVDQLKRDIALLGQPEEPWLIEYFALMQTPEPEAGPA